MEPGSQAGLRWAITVDFHEAPPLTNLDKRRNGTSLLGDAATWKEILPQKKSDSIVTIDGKRAKIVIEPRSAICWETELKVIKVYKASSLYLI